MKYYVKIKLLSLVLTLALIFNVNCLQTEATTVENFVEKKTAVDKIEGIDIPENSTFVDLRLHKDIYEDMTYERWWQGPEPAPVIELDMEPEIVEESKDIYMGTFKVTYYCGCYPCSEGWGNMTSTGVRAKEGRTIAVDPSVIPYGTRVLVNGQEYIAEDCGGAIKGNDIDIYLEDHDRVYESGVDYYDVYILKD